MPILNFDVRDDLGNVVDGVTIELILMGVTTAGVTGPPNPPGRYSTGLIPGGNYTIRIIPPTIAIPGIVPLRYWVPTPETPYPIPLDPPTGPRSFNIPIPLRTTTDPRVLNISNISNAINGLKNLLAGYNTQAKMPKPNLNQLEQMDARIQDELSRLAQTIRVLRINPNDPLYGIYLRLIEDFTRQTEEHKTIGETADKSAKKAGQVFVPGRRRRRVRETPETAGIATLKASLLELRTKINEFNIASAADDLKEMKKLDKEIQNLIKDIQKQLRSLAGLPGAEEITKEFADLVNAYKSASADMKSREETEKGNVERGEAGIFKKGEGRNISSWFNFIWLKANLVRILLALGLTIFFFVAFYGPLFGALRQSLPLPVTILLGFLFFFIMFFTLPRPDSKPKDWVNLIISILLAVGTWIGIKMSPLSGGAFIQWGVPLAVYLLSYYTTKKNKSPTKTLITSAGILIIIGGVLLVWNLFSSGAAFNIETYLKAIDVLHLIGVPQDTTDSVKDGIRNTLSFLQFKGAEPLKPEAKKIGGFEAIQLKFGSRYNDYILPTLFARMDYIVPVTVTNPNKFDTKLVVNDFVIEDIFLNNGSNRIMCGGIPTKSPDSPVKGLIDNIGSINPEEEKLISIDFKGRKTSNNELSGEKINCLTVLTYKNPPPKNPMYPAKVSISNVKKEECIEAKCKPIIDNFCSKYQLNDPNKPNETCTTAEATPRSNDVCECKINRYYNVMDELCFMNNNKATITLKSSYDFKVQGKGELILVKTEADRKLAPKPTITSSAGPLTVTTYFVSDVHIPEKSKTSIMFIQITNDGDGNAQINEIIIDYQKPTYQKIDGLEIEQCSPMPDKSKNVTVTVTEDGITISCPVKIVDDKIVNAITGGYRTVPIIVDVDYTYSQTHSTTVNVKKESIPKAVEEEGGDRAEELEKQLKPLPYYCPSGLQIYNPEVK